MGSPSPAPTKLKKESPTTSAGPHRRTSSVTSSCVSLDSADQDVHSPARSTGPGKSPVTRSTSSPRTPAQVNPGEKTVSPAAMTKRRSSIGGTEDLVRGLDFSTSSSPVNEEKKLHSFLAKGGGHKKVAQPASIPAQASSQGKKTGTTPPGKEKLFAGRATYTPVLSPRKLSDGRENSKKDISSPQKPVLASEGSSMNGVTSANSETGNTEQVARRKSSPLRGSIDGKMGKSPSRLNTKSKSELVPTKGRTMSNGDQLVSSIDQAESKTDFKFSSGVSLDGKIGKSPSQTSSLKSRSSLTSSTGRKLTKSRQDTPSPPQLGRVKTQVDKAARNGELSRPEMESVEVPVYAEFEYEREARFENVVNMSQKMSAPLQHREADEETSALLASLMVAGNVGDDDMSSLEQGVEPGFDNDMELPTSWLSEDLPCMFSSLSHLPEPDDSSSSLLGDPPEVLDEPFQRSSNGNLLAVANDIILPDIARNVVVSSPQSPSLTVDEKIVIVDNPREVSNGVHQHPADDSAWNYKTSSLSHMVGDPVDKFEAELRTQIDAANEPESPQLLVPQVEDLVRDFEAELRTQIDAANEPESPQLLVPQVEDSVCDFEAELRTQIDATYELESPQLSASPVGQEYVVPVAISKSSVAVDKGRTMPFKFTSLPQHTSSSTRDSEFSVTESVANEAFPQSLGTEVTENVLTVEGQNQLISSHIVGDLTERSQVVPTYLEGDEESFQLDSPSNPTLQEEGRRSTIEDEISTLHSSPNQLVFELSDDELLEGIVEDSDSAQMNLKQSFDDVAEPFVVSRSRVDEIDISHPNTENTVPVDMVAPREDICTKNVLEQWTTDPRKLALPSESEFPVELLDEQDHEAFTPTNLDQDMKVFEEYWSRTVTDESSQSDAGQNDAEDLLPSTLSETQLLNTIEDEAEDSLPPIELPASILPVVGKLKFTVAESIDLEPPGQSSAEVGGTKICIVEVTEEILPREGSPCPDSTESLPASDDYQIEVESSNKGEVEEFDEVFHLFGGSEELNSSVFLFDNLSSPSRPNTLADDLIQEPLGPILSESFEETKFSNAGESDSNDRSRFTASTLTTRHPHVVDAARVVLDVQDRDVEMVTEHQDLSIKKLSAQDVSVDELLHDPHHIASRSGALDDPADQEPIYEDLGTPPILTVNSNNPGVNIRHWDDDEASDESVTSEDLDFSIEDPNLLLRTAIQNDFYKSSAGTPAMSKTHDVMTLHSNEVLELGEENPSMLQRVEFYGNNLETAEEDGGMNADLTDNGESLISDDSILKTKSSQSPPNREFSGLIVDVAAETDDRHDLDSEFSPKLHMVEGDQTLLVSPQSSSSAGAAAEGVDRSESNAPFLPVGGIEDEQEQTEANFWSDLDKREESSYAAVHIEGHVYGAATHGDRQESIEHDSFQIHGDDEVQGDERISASALKIGVESHRDVNISEFDQEPQISLLIPSEISETLEDCSTEDETPHHVTEAAVDKSLPVGVLDERSTQFPSVACSPMFNEEDEMITDKFDTKSEVNSTASRDMVIPGTEAIIDYTDSASSTEVLRKDEEIHIVAAPFVLSAEESTFTNATPSVVADERREITTEDLEINQDKSEEASSIISTSALPLSELIQHHNHKVQKTHLPLGKFASIDDQVSPTEPAPEKERAFVTPSDAEFDEDRPEAEFEDHVIKNVEIIPENCSSRDLPLKLFVTSSQDTPNLEISDFDDVKEDPDFSWKGDKLEVESLYGTLERSNLPKDVGMVVDSPEKPFIVSDQYKEVNVDIDKSEGESCFSSKTGKQDVFLNGRFEEEPSLEDEETVVFSPKHSHVSDSGSDTEILGTNNIGNHSSISWMDDNDEESLNESVEEKSLLEDEETVVYSNDDTSDATCLGAIDIQNHPTVSWKADSEEEFLNENMDEKTFVKDDDMAMDSLKSLFVISGVNTIMLDDSEMDEQLDTSWTADKNDKSLNGSLKRDSMLEDEEIVVSNLNNPSSDSLHETPGTKISGVNIQNHSKLSWRADKDELESLNRSLESEDSLLEDEDTVVYKPMESLVTSGQDHPDPTPLDDDEMEGHLRFLENADMKEKSLGGDIMEEAMPEVETAMPEVETAIPEVETAIPEVEEAMPEVETAMPEVETAMPEAEEAIPEGEAAMSEVDEAMPEVEESMPEVQETVVENHVETLVVQNKSNLEALIVDDMEKHPTWSDNQEEEESLNGNVMARESMVEVQEVVENPVKSIVVPNLLKTSAESLNGVAETEEHPSWKTQEEEATLIRSLEKSLFEAEETAVGTPKESSAVSDQEVNINAGISDVGELEKDSTWTTDKEGERSNRNLEEESVLEVQETVMDPSSKHNVKDVLVTEIVPKVNGEIYTSKNSNSDYMGEDLVCQSHIEGGAMIPNEINGNKVHIRMDHIIDEDSDLGKANRSAAVVDCEIPEKTNANDLHEPVCPQETSASTETMLVVTTGVSSLESNPENMDSQEGNTEPESPEATLYPLLASQPPFSGSQQDRLWEEQAEAYSSGGRGTPARNEDATPAAAPNFHPPSSPGEQPISSDDQIQPASGPMNNGHAVAGPSHGPGENGSSQHEAKGKGKLHTPLRSLLLEDSNRSSDGDSSASNAVTSSPSFIRRLFRVMSTPSRSAERAVVSHPKLKKSSSMWINCLGSPQVQQ